MNELEISCASTDRKSNAWDSIDWLRCEIAVKKLQARIVKAQKEGRYGKVKALQLSLIHIYEIYRRTYNDTTLYKPIKGNWYIELDPVSYTHLDVYKRQ